MVYLNVIFHYNILPPKLNFGVKRSFDSPLIHAFNYTISYQKKEVLEEANLLYHLYKFTVISGL